MTFDLREIFTFDGLTTVARSSVKMVDTFGYLLINLTLNSNGIFQTEYFFFFSFDEKGIKLFMNIRYSDVPIPTPSNL